MRLMRPQKFQSEYFAKGDAPDTRTIRSWVQLGILPGRIINTGQRNQVYVDADAWERTTGDPLADKILAADSGSKRRAAVLLEIANRPAGQIQEK